MKTSLGRAPDQYSASAWQRTLANIEESFGRVFNWPKLSTSSALNFAAPAAVPGVTDQNVTMTGAELGDTVQVGCSITAPAGFMPPIGFVASANTVTVRWLQVSGVAADPDGAGATYRIDCWRH